jgi:hypothetical protein
MIPYSKIKNSVKTNLSIGHFSEYKSGYAMWANTRTEKKLYETIEEAGIEPYRYPGSNIRKVII